MHSYVEQNIIVRIKYALLCRIEHYSLNKVCLQPFEQPQNRTNKLEYKPPSEETRNSLRPFLIYGRKEGGEDERFSTAFSYLWSHLLESGEINALSKPKTYAEYIYIYVCVCVCIHEFSCQKGILREHPKYRYINVCACVHYSQKVIVFTSQLQCVHVCI